MTGSAAPVRRRRLLMIARDYPPANSSGALRSLKFAQYLSEYGWDTTVVTIRDGFHPHFDPGLLTEMPPGHHVYRAFGFDTKRALSIRGRYPRVLALPDRSVSWLPAGVVQALRAIRRARVDALFSTSPPATAHCIALLVQQVTKLSWLVDLRDPWKIGPPRGTLLHGVETWLRRHILRAASGIVVTTAGIGEDLVNGIGLRRDKVHVIFNGYDEDNFRHLPANGASKLFLIAHIGQSAPPYRDPTPFLEAVRDCLDRGRLPGNMQVAFVGAGDSRARAPLERLARRLDLDDVMRVIERLPHQQALTMMLKASVLLLLQDRDALRTTIPTKAFEYLRTGRHILAVAPTESETARFLRGFPGVFVAAPTGRTEIAEQLVSAYQAWRRTDYICRDSEVAPYARRVGAAELARVLDRLCAPGPPDGDWPP